MKKPFVPCKKTAKMIRKKLVKAFKDQAKEYRKATSAERGWWLRDRYSQMAATFGSVVSDIDALTFEFIDDEERARNGWE